MYRFLTLALIFLFGTTPAFAMCTWNFAPPGRVYEPVDATEAFLSYENGMQRVVMQPEFRGNAEDFAIVYPTPSKPEVTAASETLFMELNDFTNPEQFVVMPMMFDDNLESVGVANKGVTVIEEKEVGDYVATVLTADTGANLIEWLQDNDYDFDEDDTEKMNYYTERDGFHFIVLKVNMSEAETDEDGFVLGQLSPIEFAFAADTPQLPMRTLESEMGDMVFDLYTLGSHAIYIPGVDVMWSGVVGAELMEQVPTLREYDPKGKWLTRHEVRFAPAQISEDVVLEVAEGKFVDADVLNPLRIDPNKLDSRTGIHMGTRGAVKYLGGGGTFTFPRNLTIGSVGSDVRSLQQFLNQNGFQVAQVGIGSAGQESSYFGSLTKDAVIRFQNFYRNEVLTPIGLSVGTGYFGNATRSFIQQNF